MNQQHLQRPSLPTINAQCYLNGYPEDCQQNLSSLYLLLNQQSQMIDKNTQNISLVACFKLLKIWQFDIPFSLLASLFSQANKAAHQNLNLEINAESFHQIMHNPQLQTHYRRKPVSKIILQSSSDYTQNRNFTTPQTLFSLFTRLGELIQRKILYTQVNDESIPIRDKFGYMMQMMNVGQVAQPKQITTNTELFATMPSIIQQKNDTILLEDQEQSTINIPNKKLETLEKSIESRKFTKILSEDKFKMNSRMRKLHQNMMKQMDMLRKDNNVVKVSNLIHKTQGNFFIKLPDI